MTALTSTPFCRTRPTLRAASARGAAYVEAILLIFFMVIIFGGVIYLGNYFEAQQRTLGIARRCAWEFSWNACTTDPECGTGGTHHACLPAVCDGLFGKDDEPNDDLKQDINNAQFTAQTSNGNSIDNEGKDAQRKKDLRAGVDTQLGPFLKMIVGQNIMAIASGNIARPASLPNAESSIDVAYFLPCNLKHEDPLPVAISLFTDLLGGQL